MFVPVAVQTRSSARAAEHPGGGVVSGVGGVVVRHLQPPRQTRRRRHRVAVQLPRPRARRHRPQRRRRLQRGVEAALELAGPRQRGAEDRLAADGVREQRRRRGVARAGAVGEEVLVAEARGGGPGLGLVQGVVAGRGRGHQLPAPGAAVRAVAVLAVAGAGRPGRGPRLVGEVLPQVAGLDAVVDAGVGRGVQRQRAGPHRGQVAAGLAVAVLARVAGQRAAAGQPLPGHGAGSHEVVGRGLGPLREARHQVIGGGSVVSILVPRVTLRLVSVDDGCGRLLLPVARLLLVLGQRVLGHVGQQLGQRLPLLVLLVRVQDGPGALLDDGAAPRPRPRPAVLETLPILPLLLGLAAATGDARAGLGAGVEAGQHGLGVEAVEDGVEGFQGHLRFLGLVECLFVGLKFVVREAWLGHTKHAVVSTLRPLISLPVNNKCCKESGHYLLELETKDLLRDCEIFGNIRITFVSSTSKCPQMLSHTC